MEKQDTKQALKLELIFVVLLTIGLPLLIAMGEAGWLVRRPPTPFGYFHFTECIRGLYLIGVVVFTVWLKGESWVQLGMVRPRWGTDLAVGVLVMLLSFLLRVPFAIAFTLLGPDPYSPPFQTPSSTSDYPWIIISAVFVGFAEELLTRGYLISRLEQLFNRWKCVLVSSLVFAIWHISRGLEYTTYAFIVGLVFGTTFITTHRLWPVVIAHAINNARADFVSLGK